MDVLKSFIKSLIQGGIGGVVGAAFATAFGWNVWILAIIGFIAGWLLLSNDFWEGIKEGQQELAEEEKQKEEEERRRKEAEHE